jgi:DNA polymerase I
MEADKKGEIFMVVDGSAIVHRAYHAMPPFTNSSGVPTGAVHGFFSMLLKLVQELSPAHIAIAFDRPKPTFRKEMYVGYQANRPKMKSDLSEQFGMIIEILAAAKIPEYAVDGFEADDVIGTLAAKFEVKDPDRKTYIVTGDRDMLQLVDAQTKVLMPVKGISEVKLFDENDVKEKYDVTPAQFIDLKALTGDASDNYPGVPGVGPKSASKLIEEYGNFDNIYKHLDAIAIKNKGLSEKLISGAEEGELSKKLATILTDVPFSFDFVDCRFENIDIDGFRDILTKNEFKTLPKRVTEVFSKNDEMKKGKQMKLI